MKSTGIISSILLIGVLTILLNMSANVVEASYKDAETTEAELRFPFNKELEKVTNENFVENKNAAATSASDESVSEIQENVEVKETSFSEEATGAKTTLKSDNSKTNNFNEIENSRQELEVSETAVRKTFTKEESSRPSNTYTKSSRPASPVAKEEAISESMTMVEEVEITINEDVKETTADIASEYVEGEIIIEDVSIIETSLFDIVDNMDIPVTEEANESLMSAEDKAFFDLYEAAVNSPATVEDRSAEFAAFIRPFQQLIVSETGDDNAHIENIKIYDVYGKKVMEVTDVDLGGSAFNILPRGNYTIEVISGSAFHTAILSKL